MVGCPDHSCRGGVPVRQPEPAGEDEVAQNEDEYRLDKERNRDPEDGKGIFDDDIPFEGEERARTGIIGCAYGSRESEIVRHIVVKEDNYEERVSKIYELGMAYKIQPLFSLFSGFDLDIYVTTEKQLNS